VTGVCLPPFGVAFRKDYAQDVADLHALLGLDQILRIKIGGGGPVMPATISELVGLPETEQCALALGLLELVLTEFPKPTWQSAANTDIGRAWDFLRGRIPHDRDSFNTLFGEYGGYTPLVELSMTERPISSQEAEASVIVEYAFSSLGWNLLPDEMGAYGWPESAHEPALRVASYVFDRGYATDADLTTLVSNLDLATCERADFVAELAQL